MQGLKALLRVRRIAEDKALEELGRAQRALAAIRSEERQLAERARETREALRTLERGRFGVRQSLVYRRYLNAMRSRIARVRQRAGEAQQVVVENRRAYEKSLNDRKAVGELIERRQERARKERSRREERTVGDLAQNAWARGAETAGRP